ncbi:protein crumbs homolog 1-like [Brienomyrus brachyistius]|uniref:protein crumbs homolog 1-like n=1 Tax=Brienomyrus brachyistius TaxID=42636 RepID=UPI0020B20C1C|nr:protein crumbs homolog 1-like [Brienomyrus brachyistius]
MKKLTCYLWVLLLFNKGASCDNDTDVCDSNPCQNGGSCEKSFSSYTCHCSNENQNGIRYGGPNCTEALVGCRGHQCRNEGTCFPFLSDELHGYQCLCPGGFTGSYCQESTTFSFETDGYVHLETSVPDTKADLNMTLSFRTAQGDGLLFQRDVGGLLLRLQLLMSHLHLSLQEDSEPAASLALPQNVTDGWWHTVEIILGQERLSIGLLDSSCQEDCEKQMAVKSNRTKLELTRCGMFIGGVRGESGAGLPHFIGCLRDLHVDNVTLVPVHWPKGSAESLTHGCIERDQCVDDPCQSRGRCHNQWPSYKCECDSPFEGQDCSEENMAGRFGDGGLESYAVFTIDDNPGRNMVLSMLVRTRRRSGLLFALANTTSPYLRLWLQGGKARVQADQAPSLTGRLALSDGALHHVAVRVQQDQMALFLSSQKQGELSVSMPPVRSGDAVYLGGLTDRRSSASFGGYFKGCIQDVRINSRRLQLYPTGRPPSSYALERLVNVTRGCAGDSTCRNNPCQNGGVCYPTWDGYKCSCPAHAAGRHCEEAAWCELSPCPPAGLCQPRAQGFECFSNATFYDDSDVISYKGNGKISRTLSYISFRIRTRKLNCVILHAERGPEFVTVFIRNSYLLLELVTGPDPSLKLTLKSQHAISDGEWHSAEFSMLDPSLPSSKWIVNVDGKRTISIVRSGNLDFLKDEADIFLGGFGVDVGGSLAGCLSTVEVGGIALPYHGNSEVNILRVQDEQFLKTSPRPVLGGCSGADACVPNPCLNGGVCLDLFNLFSCTCPSGWMGPRCELRTNPCSINPCAHGNCSIHSLGYQCICDTGYTGVNCEEKTDPCLHHQCSYGATCLRGIHDYSCQCRDNSTGKYCHEKIKELPWYIDKIR